MGIVPAGKILCPLAIGKSTYEPRGTRVLGRGLAGFVFEHAIHGLPNEFSDRDPLASRDRPQAPGLLGCELNLGALHEPSVGTP